jgi:hypothetical protein
VLKPIPSFISHKTTEHIVAWNVNVALKPSSSVMLSQHAKLSRVDTVGTLQFTLAAGNRSFEYRSNVVYCRTLNAPSPGQAFSCPACQLN